MQVHISIGENHRFELREALLIYGDRQRSFVTRHQVTLHKQGPPTLEPAQPLTHGFLESLVRSLSGSSTAEILPENVLAKGDRMIVWWTAACRRQMFYENSEQKATGLNGRRFPQPTLVWRVEGDDLKIRALAENRRPAATTPSEAFAGSGFGATLVVGVLLLERAYACAAFAATSISAFARSRVFLSWRCVETKPTSVVGRSRSAKKRPVTKHPAGGPNPPPIPGTEAHRGNHRRSHNEVQERYWEFSSQLKKEAP